MSHDIILLTIRARLQAPDKSYIPGVLTVHGTRVSWQALDIHAAAPVSYLAAGITNTQKAKGKPFLRLAAGKAASVFEFDSESERERAVMEISGIMQSGGGGGEASRDADIAGLSRQQRTAILKEEPDTAMLFNDLVGSGSLTDSEFWIKYTQTHSMPDRSAVGSSQASRTGSSGSGARDQPPTQHVGMQNAMLQVKATSVNNTLTIKISEPDKQAVFHEKPHVLRAYQSNVPGNMSEEEFWRRFYLHEEGKKARRKAANDVGHVQYTLEEGIFREKGGGAAAAAASREKLRRLNPAINLATQSGEAYMGFGLAHRESAIPTALADATEQLARDINRHAEVVLQGVRSLRPPQQQQQQPNQAGGSGSSSSAYIKTLSSGQPPAVTPRSSPPPSDPEWEPAGIERLAVVATDRFASPGTATGSLSRKAPSNLRLQLQHKLHVSATTDTDGVPKRRPGGDVLSGTDWMRGSESTRESEEELGELGPAARAEGAGLEDLATVAGVVTESLDIRDPRRYFETPASGADQGQDPGSSHGGVRAAGEPPRGPQPALFARTSGARLANPLLPPMLAEQILWEATPATRVLGDVDHYGAPTRPPQEALLPDVVAVQRNFVLQANELSRHFWGTIPATTAAQLEKVSRIHPQTLDTGREPVHPWGYPCPKPRRCLESGHACVLQAERLTRSMEVLKGKVHTSIDMVSGPERAYIRQLVRPALDAVEAAFASGERSERRRCSGDAPVIHNQAVALSLGSAWPVEVRRSS
ncbi:MAG: hypothetical protein WDW38_011410 [Sanguina aurantia]